MQLTHLLKAMVEREASDLYLTVGLPPMLRILDAAYRESDRPLKAEEMEGLASSILSERQRADFAQT